MTAVALGAPTRAAAAGVAAGVRRHAFPIALSLVAAALALVGLGDRSIWIDEAITAAVSGFSTDQFAESWTGSGGNMALYYLLMHGWLQLGHEEWILRLPSVLFAVATVPLIFRLASRALDRRSAQLASVLAVGSVPFLHYAQEARSYSLFLLLVTAAWLALARVVERESPARWAVYAALAAASVYAHLFAVLFVVAQLGSLALLPRGAITVRWLARSATAIAVAVAPLLAVAVNLDGARPVWIPPLSAGQVGELVVFLAGGGALARTLLVSAAALAGATLLLRRVIAGGRSVEAWRLGMPVLWLGLPAVLAIALAAREPLLVDRYLIAALPAAAIVAAAAIGTLRPPALAVAAVVLAIALAAPAALDRYGTPEEQWVHATSLVLDRAEPGDGIAFYQSARTPFEYYWERAGRPALVPEPIAGGTPWRHTRRFYAPIDHEGIDQALLTHPRVWLVDRGPFGSPGWLVRSLERRFVLVEDTSYTGPVRVRLYAERP